MYAIAFDMDTNELKARGVYPDAYRRISEYLAARGFGHKQGSVYMGDRARGVDAVATIMTVMDLTREYDWFAPSVKDIRMFLIEDTNDLMPIVERASGGAISKLATSEQATEATLFNYLNREDPLAG